MLGFAAVEGFDQVDKWIVFDVCYRVFLEIVKCCSLRWEFANIVKPLFAMQERYGGHIHSWYICQSLKRFQNILIRYCFVFLASRALHLVCRSLFWSSDRLVGTLISSASILILYLIIRKATHPRPGGLAPLHLQNGFFVKNKARLKSCCSLCKFIPIRLIVNW